MQKRHVPHFTLTVHVTVLAACNHLLKTHHSTGRLVDYAEVEHDQNPYSVVHKESLRDLLRCDVDNSSRILRLPIKSVISVGAFNRIGGEKAMAVTVLLVGACMMEEAFPS